jgi:hypothetical protein
MLTSQMCWTTRFQAIIIKKIIGDHYSGHLEVDPSNARLRTLGEERESQLSLGCGLSKRLVADLERRQTRLQSSLVQQ